MTDSVTDWINGFYELNPDAVPAEEAIKKSKDYKNDLFKDILPALDRKDIRYYSKLTDEQKKDISIFTLTRWMSSIESSTADQLCLVNDVVNKNSGIFSSAKLSRNTEEKNKHKELQWMLLAICGTGRKERHVWPTAAKGKKKSLLEEALVSFFPLMKDDELDMLQQINTKEDFEQFFKDNAFDDKAIKEIFKGDTKGK